MEDTTKRGCGLHFTRERIWSRGYLKKLCEDSGVEHEYLLHQRRISNAVLAQFIFLHVVFTTIQCIILILACTIPNLVYYDILLYVTAAIIISLLLSVNLNDEIVGKHSHIAYITSVFTALILIFVDLTIVTYHFKYDHWNITFTYNMYCLYMVYLYLPIPDIIGPAILGCTSSIIYFFAFHFFVVNLNRSKFFIAEIFHYSCFNLIGIFFRLVSDITVRSSFIDRHQYIVEEVLHKNARRQERKLLDSILPPQIAQPLHDNIRLRIAMTEKHRHLRVKKIRECITAFQEHPDVSILYADVVNYTHLTTKLTVKELVTLLHDLYARFDMSAKRFHVQRIKFLGDCYYCVAGLTSPDPLHATNCVELGHHMIAHIREVRSRRNLDIDMRIGVHSGTVLAGLIGEAKLQFDIWGNDVLIANKLESTGLPGHIHISEKTRSLIWDYPHEILPGPPEAQENPFLLKYEITTYLIAGKKNSADFTAIDLSTETSFDQHNDHDNSIQEALHREFATIPVGVLELNLLFKRKNNYRSNVNPNINFLWLQFRDARLEYNYMRQPDYLLKYSVLLAWWVLVALIFEEKSNAELGSNETKMMSITIFVVYTLMLLTIWYKQICFWVFGPYKITYSGFSCMTFRFIEKLQRNLIARIIIFLLTILMYFIIITIFMSGCEREEFYIRLIESKIYYYNLPDELCFRPWSLTKMACLSIGMTWIYTGIPFPVKFVVSAFQVFTYVIVIFFHFNFKMNNSRTTNPTLPPVLAHTLLTLLTWVFQCFMERDFEFNNKMNYHWRVELHKKQEYANITNQSITVLLHNILPAHVVNLYLSSLEQHELYYENYEMVAVMFASLRNFSQDVPNLRILHEIISDFDKCLAFYKNNCLVEKIKVVGCTYMAACGLDLRYGGIKHDPQNAILRDLAQAQRHLASFHINEVETFVKNQEVVAVLTNFALDLMKNLSTINKQFQNIPVDREMSTQQMSIGISSGEVMAGVVGASQVHYDIWGNAVNMASRMDSTGVPGCIQVTEESALVLKKCGINCTFRGMTFIKGRGMQPTYFVGITDDMEFIY